MFPIRFKCPGIRFISHPLSHLLYNIVVNALFLSPGIRVNKRAVGARASEVCIKPYELIGLPLPPRHREACGARRYALTPSVLSLTASPGPVRPSKPSGFASAGAFRPRAPGQLWRRFRLPWGPMASSYSQPPSSERATLPPPGGWLLPWHASPHSRSAWGSGESRVSPHAPRCAPRAASPGEGQG